MWLQYALEQNDNLVSVHDVKRGKSNIRCPYCRGELTAKKGKIKVHHFAHVADTCHHVKNKNVNLPLFWGFDLVLSREYRNILLELESRNFKPKHFTLKSLQKQEDKIFSYLKRKKVIDLSFGCGELTDLGKIILKKLTLLDFCEIQEKLSKERFIKLRQNFINEENSYENIIKYKKIHYNKSSLKKKKTINFNLELREENLKQAEIDFRLYCAQYQRVIQRNLYFLQIKTDPKIFYKIGVTSRNIKERIQEINIDLSKLFDDFSISLLGIWFHRGNVEHYFKYRYEDYRFPLGSLTEYFQFEDIESILAEFKALDNKQLDRLEQDIINNSYHQLLFSQRVSLGMKLAEYRGIHIGRPQGETESVEKFLAKPKSQAIASVLKKGLSLRQTASEVGVSVNTVRKVQAALHQVVTQKSVPGKDSEKPPENKSPFLAGSTSSKLGHETTSTFAR